MKQYFDDPNPGATALVGFVFVILVGVIIVALQSFYKVAAGEEFDEKIVRQAYLDRANTQAEQRRTLEEYAWIDRDAGTVRIPIERAMELVVREASEGSR